MRLSRGATASFAALLVLSGTSASFAQTDTSNPDVVPAPESPTDGVLLYPGDQYGRVVRPLLQPGDPYPGTTAPPLHLHMPRKHVAKKAKPPSAPSAVAALDNSTTNTAPADTNVVQPTTPAVAPAPPPAMKPHPASKPAKTQIATQKPVQASPAQAPSPGQADSSFASAVPFSFGPSTEPNTAPAPSPPAPPARVAKATPPPAQTMDFDVPAPLPPGLAKQTQILFAPGAPDPSADAVDAIKGLAGPLNSALVAGTSRIQIVAYGGARGDKSSDARRLSLKRARIIRQLLIDGGVPAERIDVRAMGGATDGAATDRVDIFTKA